MTRNTTTKPSAITAAMVIRALQDATPTAYATRDDMHRDAWTTEHQARALVYLCSETADSTPQEYWEEQQFNIDGIREQRHYGILPGDHDIRARIESTRHAVQLATDAAAAELRAHDADRFIRIRAGERSSIKIMNTRERIADMLATVRRSPSLFGGGPIEKPAKARPAASWKPRSVAMVWEMLQDGDAAGALDLADTMGAMFFSFSGGSRTGMTWAPLPVEGMPGGFVSARRCDGQWSVFHTGSMLALNGNGKPTSRAKAEQFARDFWNSKAEAQQAHALQAAANSPQDQAEARAAWLKLHSITTEAETAQPDETTDTTPAAPEPMVSIISALTGATLGTLPQHQAQELADTEAARQVSELIASATTAATIEHASERTTEANHQDEAEHASELATVDAEADTPATTCDASSAGNAGSAPTHGHASSSAHQAPTVATPGTYWQHTGQQVAGKSGNWCALMFTDDAGRPSFEFDGHGKAREVLSFATGRERMAALQAMAREADELARSVEEGDDGPDAWPLDPMTATAADVQALSAADFGVFFDRLEDINYHGECLLLRTLRAGRDDLAERARANIRAHLAAGHLAPELAAERQAIDRELTASEAEQAPATHTPSATPAPAGEYHQLAPVPKTETTPEPKPADNMPRAVPDEIASLDSIRAAIYTNEREMARIIKGKQRDAAERAYKIELIISALTDKLVELQKKMKQAPADNMPRAVADDFTPEFTLTVPQPFDMLSLIAAGMAPEKFVGLGIAYSGDRANCAGRGAITDIQPCNWYKWRVTVTLDDGRVSVLNPISFTDGIGNRFKTDYKVHGAPYLAELDAARLAVEASRKASELAAADQKARQRRELPQQWPQLKAYDPAGKLNGPTLAAHNIRVLLKERFPKIKFSVKSDRYSGGDAIDIRWTDGPNTKAVEKIADQFEAGSFNGQEDIYEYAHSVFRDLFGDAKYIHCHRDISDALLSQAIAAEYPGTESRPTVEDYRKAQGVFSYQHRDEWHARRIRERLETMGAGLPS